MIEEADNPFTQMRYSAIQRRRAMLPESLLVDADGKTRIFKPNPENPRRLFWSAERLNLGIFKLVESSSRIDLYREHATNRASRLCMQRIDQSSHGIEETPGPPVLGMTHGSPT